MIKIVIADDESDAMNRLSSLLKNFKDDFEVVGAFANGYDALEGVLSLAPDLLITDIKMPFIDGIEVIKRSKVELPLLQSIIITGYDSFDFAKQAIDLGVVGYISKPITQEELGTVLAKAKTSISRQLEIDTNLSTLQEKEQTELRMFQQNDLCRILSLKSIPENLWARLKQDKVDLTKKYLALAVYDYDQEIDQIDFDKVELANYYQHQYTQSEIGRCHSFYCFDRSENVIVIVADDQPMKPDELESLFSVIRSKIEKTTGISISIACSEIDEDEPRTRNFRKLFRHAIRTLSFRTVTGGGEVLFFDDVKKEEVNVGKVDDHEYDALTYDLLYGRPEQVKERLASLVERITSVEYADSHTFIVSNIVNALLKACTSLHDLYANYSSNNDILSTAISAKGAHSLLSLLDRLVDEIIQVNEKTRTGGIKSSSEQLQDYIALHYADPGISLDSVSSALNYSVSYISLLLKKEGTSFTKYVTELRMQKAKELLADPNSKVIVVASQVGYSDPFYFSHCFKKFYGVSPADYRKK
jgi:two-component system response regulator YesN